MSRHRLNYTPNQFAVNGRNTPFFSFLSRSLVLFALLGFVSLLPTSMQVRADHHAKDTRNLLVLGDSLSAAYGIQIQEGWVYQLSLKLKDSYRVINASISGETTDGGLRSLPGLLEKYHPEIVIIELGANDGLRGFPIDVIEKNLRQLVTLSKAITDKVLLLGIHIPPNYGKAYTEAFHKLFEKIANEHSIARVPFFLDGVATDKSLMQDDGLHPNAKAQPIILDTVWPALEPLLTAELAADD